MRKNDVRWEERDADHHLFFADGYEGSIERVKVNVNVALILKATGENLIPDFSPVGRAFGDWEWESGLPKWKLQVEETYRQHSARGT